MIDECSLDNPVVVLSYDEYVDGSFSRWTGDAEILGPVGVDLGGMLALGIFHDEWGGHIVIHDIPQQTPSRYGFPEPDSIRSPWSIRCPW